MINDKKKIFIILLFAFIQVNCMDEYDVSVEKSYLESLPALPTTWLNNISAKDIQKNIIPAIQEHINKFLIGDNEEVSAEFIEALKTKLKFEHYKRMHTAAGKYLIVQCDSSSYHETLNIINPINKVYIVDLDQIQVLDVIEHADVITKVISNNKYVITASFDGSIKIYDFLEKKQTVINHNGRVTSVELSADSNFLVTIAEDRTSKVIDLRTKNETDIITGLMHSSPIS